VRDILAAQEKAKGKKEEKEEPTGKGVRFGRLATAKNKVGGRYLLDLHALWYLW
jgi:hypothetical protein